MVELALEFDERLYSVEALQKAAYRYIHVLVADFSLGEGKVHCLLTPKHGVGDETFPRHVQEFKNEVLDQQLRLKIREDTEQVRNLILGIAFSNTGLQTGE